MADEAGTDLPSSGEASASGDAPAKETQTSLSSKFRERPIRTSIGLLVRAGLLFGGFTIATMMLFHVASEAYKESKDFAGPIFAVIATAAVLIIPAIIAFRE
jgi:hypothetical protein